VEDPFPKDLTGDWDASAERNRLRGILGPLQAYDGGMLWDNSNKTLTVRMTSDNAIEQARGLIAESATTLQIRFARVQYSAMELDDLANQLLTNQEQWAGASGIGGGHDLPLNRVLLQVDPNYKDGGTLTRAIQDLNDPRILLQLLPPGGDEGGPRVATMIMPRGPLARTSFHPRMATGDPRMDMEVVVY
jgi:hypothetical protein